VERTFAIFDETGDEVVEAFGVNGRVGVDGEKVLVERRIDTDDVLDLVVDFEFGGSHRRVEMNTVEETHHEHLRVTLSTVTGTLTLSGLADLDDDLCGRNKSQSRRGEREERRRKRTT
jgi:hypothetical protein